MQKIIYFCLILAKIIRQVIYLFIGVTVFVFIHGFGFGDGIDPSKKTSAVIFISSIVVLILISYALPYLLKNKWPTEVANAELLSNKPRKIFTWIAIALVILSIIVLLIFMQSI